MLDAKKDERPYAFVSTGYKKLKLPFNASDRDSVQDLKGNCRKVFRYNGTALPTAMKAIESIFIAA